MAPRPPAHRPPPAGTPSSQDLVEELVATVAHELRRPLTALLGALATLQQRGPALPVAQQQELLAMARRQGIQLQRLLEQLLVAAALDHPPPGPARPLLVDAATLATEATVAAQLAHPNHQIVIQAVGPLLVRVDPLAITRILGNLLDNAATHSPAGAPIQLIGSCKGTRWCWPSRIRALGSQRKQVGGSSSGTRGLIGTAGRLSGGWAWGCTSPGSWPSPTAAICGSATRPAAAAPASSFASRWRSQ